MKTLFFALQISKLHLDGVITEEARDRLIRKLLSICVPSTKEIDYIVSKLHEEIADRLLDEDSSEVL